MYKKTPNNVGEALEFYEILQKEEQSNPLRQEVKRHYVLLHRVIIPIGIELSTEELRDYIAFRMLEIYDVAIRRELEPEIRAEKMIRISEGKHVTPPSLENVLYQFCERTLSRSEAKETLAYLRDKTELYLRELGANPDPEKVKKPWRTDVKQITPDDRLEAMIYGDSLRDDGSISSIGLYANYVRYGLYRKLLNLSQSLGREPTTDDVIEVYIDLCQEVYTKLESEGSEESKLEENGFKDRREFNYRLQERERIIRKEGDSFSQPILCAFDRVRKKLRKNI